MRQFINEKKITDIWSPIIEKATSLSPSKADEKNRLTWMSMVAENQKLFEDSRNIAHVNPNMNIDGMGDVRFPGDPSYTTAFGGQTAGSGDKPYSLLPLAIQVAAQTIGLDLVPVVPMPGPLGMLTYLDFVYAGGRLDSLESPLVIKVPVTATSGVTLEAGTIYYARESATNYYQFTYIGKSRIDGYSIFRVVPTETNGTSKGIGATGNETINYTIDNGDVYDAASAGSVVATFDGNAELVKALEDHIPSYVGRGMRLGDGVTNSTEAYLREEGEANPENMMGLTLRNKSVEAQTYQVMAAVTREQVDDLRQYGIDAVAQLESVLSNEMTQTINKLILSRMFKMGATSHTKWFENEGTNFNINISNTDQPIYLGEGMDGNIVPAMQTRKVNVSLGGESTATIQRQIMGRVLYAAHAINNHSRRGPGNFIVTNYQIASALQNVAGFAEYPMANTIAQSNGSLYNLGSVSGLQVYVDPNMRAHDTRVLVGRKGDVNSTGLVFMPYLMAQSTSIIAESTMAPKVSVKSRFALVDAGHHPEDTYITFKVENDGTIMPTIIG